MNVLIRFIESIKCYANATGLSTHNWTCTYLFAGEEEISFPPTYRYERGSRDTYVWQKQKATGVSCLLTQTTSQMDFFPDISDL